MIPQHKVITVQETRIEDTQVQCTWSSIVLLDIVSTFPQESSKFLWSSLLVQNCGSHDDLRDDVGVAVGGRASVLQVTFLVRSTVSRDSDTSPSMGHSRRELVNSGSLVQASQSALVVLAPARVISVDVHVMTHAQFLNGRLDMPEKEFLYKRRLSYTSKATHVIPPS